jgi:hypothetical protein
VRAVPQHQPLPLSVEVLAYVGVAICGIVSQTRVKWKRLVQLVDFRAGVSDRRRNVRACWRLGQRQRWCAKRRRDVWTATASRGDAGAFGALGWLVLLLPASGASRALYALHDDRCSVGAHHARCSCALRAMFLGAGRRGCSRPKDKNSKGEHHCFG